MTSRTSAPLSRSAPRGRTPRGIAAAVALRTHSAARALDTAAAPLLWGFLAYQCPRPVHPCVVGQGVARRATGGRMLTCDACDWTAPCVVVQPALSVSVACSLACHVACSLVQLHAAPVLLYGRMQSRMSWSHAVSRAMRRCFFDAAGQRAARWWGQLTGTSPDSLPWAALTHRAPRSHATRWSPPGSNP